MSTNPSTAPTLERDPVCGMKVNPATTKYVHDLGGKSYYFFCASCADKFKADPPKYLAAPAQAGRLPLLWHGSRTGSPGCVHSHRVHLPHAPGNRAARARFVSDLRHGART